MTPQQDADLDVLRSLIRAAGPTGRPIHADVETVEYDWRVPSFFSQDQLAELSGLGASLAGALSVALGGHLRKQIGFQADPVTQHFRRGLEESLSGEPAFRALVGIAERPAGTIVLGARAAVGWVASLLGAEAKADRELAGLEADLLADIVAALVKAVCEALKEAGGEGAELIGSIAKDNIRLPGDDDAEYCTFFFRTDASSEEAEIRIALLCERLGPIVGAAAREQDESGPRRTADSRSLMVEHFARSSVTAAAVVGHAQLTVREMMSLEVGDVILLPKRLDDPVELCVEGTAVSCGRAAVCSGRCAVEISGPSRAPASALAGAGRADSAPAKGKLR
ncbi:MAG: FliM/FliN family flagellar motor switch protein [Phycisphaerae bacterium]